LIAQAQRQQWLFNGLVGQGGDALNVAAHAQGIWYAGGLTVLEESDDDYKVTGGAPATKSQ
jgi:hypothetical protein